MFSLRDLGCWWASVVKKAFNADSESVATNESRYQQSREVNHMINSDDIIPRGLLTLLLQDWTLRNVQT